MRFRGGYDIALAGRPAGTVDAMPEPRVLYLPLRSRRFHFSEVCVAEGDAVRPGQALATDPANFGVPLLAPRAGTVRLGRAEGHVALEDLRPEDRGPAAASEGAGPPADAAAGRQRLVRLGAWQFFEDAHTGRLPDPAAPPRAVLVSTVRLDPFTARGSVHLAGRLDAFERGLAALQSLLEYEPIYLAMPEVESHLASQVRETLRGLAWLQVVTVPLKYPFDHPALVARRLGLRADAKGPVWALRTEGVLALGAALGAGRAATERVVTLGGPAVRSPRHVRAVVGYPLEALLAGQTPGGPVRVVSGGVLAGDAVAAGQKGLDAECAGLTVLAEATEPKAFYFLRPGWGRRSYSRCFPSALRPRFAEAMDTSLRGERRACVACGACESVCPAGILPHMIHRHLYRDALDDAARLRVDLCIGCGLCSFVCPSKIELRQQFVEAQERLRQEASAEEVPR